jgi:hypothetical protein
VSHSDPFDGAVAFADDETGWLVGTNGRIVKISLAGADND